MACPDNQEYHCNKPADAARIKQQGHFTDMGEIQFRTIARYEYQAERNHGRFDIIYQCAARRPKTFPRFYVYHFVDCI